MIGMKLDEAKGRFLDTRKLADRADRAGLRMLGKAGAFTRRKARSSIRRRKRISAAGEPPSSHSGELRNFIFFFVDPKRKSMIAGPTLLNGAGRGATVPELLERGGDAVLRRAATKKGEKERERFAHYDPRPFMAPAAETEFPKAAATIKGQVR